MNPADSDSESARLRKVIASQGDFLGQHEQALRNLGDNNQAMITQITQLTKQVATLTSHLTSPATAAQLNQPGPAPPPGPVPIPTWESYAPDPEHFSGDAGKCRGFILQCAPWFSTSGRGPSPPISRGSVLLSGY